MRVALITGITGQDGSYLAELLLSKGYVVHGLVRDLSRSATAPNLRAIADCLNLHAAPLGDQTGLGKLFDTVKPDEIYHLAGQTHVARSFADLSGTLQDNVLGTAALLGACEALPVPPRLFFASTCQIFGQPRVEPQDEETPVRPVNPYGASKACATDLVRIARDTGRLYAVSGILYNHESPRRGPEFVTGKICRAVAAIRAGRQESLTLGDTSACRDWGDARDFVEGFWRSLQAREPSDYVFATGKLHSVQDVVEIAFGAVGLDWRQFVQVDRTLFRPAEPTRLVGNPRRAEDRLGWKAKTAFPALIGEMVQAALQLPVDPSASATRASSPLGSFDSASHLPARARE